MDLDKQLDLKLGLNREQLFDAIADLVELDECIPDHRVINNWSKKSKAVFNAIKQGQKLCNVRHPLLSLKMLCG